MQSKAVEAVITGLKTSGVDFISLLPDSDFSELQYQVTSDKHFTYVPVSNEAIGVGVCAGAYLAEKDRHCLFRLRGCSLPPGRSRAFAWPGGCRCCC